MSDQLIFKIINKRTGTDGQISSFCAAAVKFFAVYRSHIINIYHIAVFDCSVFYLILCLKIRHERIHFRIYLAVFHCDLTLRNLNG